MVQGEESGLCGVYAVANALTSLYQHRFHREEREAALAAMADAWPGNFAEVFTNGMGRTGVQLMLSTAVRFVERKGWPALYFTPDHPTKGSETARSFWAHVGARINRNDLAVAIVGFGDDTRGKVTRYEPHWTCVEEAGPKLLQLRDSDEYRRVPIADTGIPPEKGWEVEDLFLVRRMP